MANAPHGKNNIEQLLVKVLAGALVVILVLLPVHAFVSTWGGTAIGPLLAWKSWKEILIALVAPLVVWLCVIRPDIARTVWARWYNKLILAYVLLTIGWVFASPASNDAVIAGLLMNLRFLALFVLGQVVMASGASWVGTLRDRLVGWLLASGVMLALLALLQVTVLPKEFLTPFGYDRRTTIAPYLLVDDDPNTMRAFATMRGPNTLAAYLLLPLAVALLLWWQKRTRWWAMGSTLLITAALFATHSRSGWLGAAVMLAVLGCVTLPRETLRTWLKFGTIPVLALVIIVLWLATTVPAVRLAVFHSGGNDPTESLTEGSSDEHWQATARGVVAIVEQPLGGGVGTAGPASFYNTNQPPNIPENYFVQIGQEIGIAGLALFIAICFTVARELWRKPSMWSSVLLASFAGINLINLFLHGWADDPTAMTWWVLAGLAVGAASIKKVKSK